MNKCYLCYKNEVESYSHCEECEAPQEPHTCPFNEEINGDCDTLCECSSYDEHNCAMEI